MSNKAKIFFGNQLIIMLWPHLFLKTKRL